MGAARHRPSAATVADIGESGLIELVVDRFGSGSEGEIWAGDDAAVLRTEPRTLLTTDMLVEGVDFDLGYCMGSDIGWKLIAVNVSDIAAMGGSPDRAVITLAMPPHTLISVIESFLDGLAEAGKEWGLDIVGGDVSSSRELSASATVLGTCDEEPVLRSGARPGDLVCVTGTLGGAAGGLFALQRGIAGHGREVERLVRRQLRPHARVAEGRRLHKATSMIDVSDGLALDLTRLMDASGTGADLTRDLIPLDPSLGALEDGPDPYDLALTGGEDFELLCTLDPATFDDVRVALEPLAGLSRIGDVTDVPGCRLDGERLDGKELGWDHMRSR